MKRIDNVGVNDLDWYIGGPMHNRIFYMRTAWRVERQESLLGAVSSQFCDMAWLEEDFDETN